ncbi:MAG: hypothetical protein IKS48_10465 [Eubacterium sp.]|nr:hypothetical protein [Eubacterium sp.]
MNKITPQDIRKGVEVVSASPESTWHKSVYTFDNGDELCLAIGMGEGFDEDTVCAKLGVLAGNSAMSEYAWDFIMPYNPETGDVWDTEVSNPSESDADWFNKEAPQIIKEVENGKLVTSSRKVNKRKPIQSMLIQDDISGEELYDLLWSGGLSNFKRMVEDGADPDQILNVCEMLLNDTGETVPTMTELNDLIWFDEETIRDYVGLTGPIESGCHGKRKKKTADERAKDEGADITAARKSVKSGRKAIKSEMQIAEIHNNTPNIYVRLVYIDCDYFRDYEGDDTPISLNEFKQMCKDFAETSNGDYMISHDNSYQPAEYVVDFANWESENGDEQLLGTIKFELLLDGGQALIDYLEDDRMM